MYLVFTLFGNGEIPYGGKKRAATLN